MGKRVIFALLVLGMLIAGGMAAQGALHRFCTDQRTLLQQGQLEQAHALWLRAEPWIASLVGHEELNQTGDCYAELMAAPPENRGPVLARLLWWLRALEQYDQPSLRSIL